MNKSTLKLVALFFISGVIFTSCSDEVATVTGDNVLSGAITSNTKLTADKIWELAGKVVVSSGVTLEIEPGTIIKGREGNGSLASALVVARGGKIMAVGTADNPIVMTSVLDNIEVGQLAGSNLDETDAGLWGGLIILGSAPISPGTGTTAQIEGIPSDESYGKYGGSNESDDSGELKYLSVRHGGALIGEGNEINGITLGGVGNSTKISYVEVVANLDDGIECFGGSVNISNALVAYQQDDAFDIDQSYSGTMDNILAIHGLATDNALEIDGPEGSANPDGRFTIKNGTFISADGSGRAASLKSKAQGTIEESLFRGYSDWVRVRANFDEANCNPKSDAYSYMTDASPKLVVKNNQFEANGNDAIAVYSDVDSCNSAPLVIPTAYDPALETMFSNDGNNNNLSPNSGNKGADIEPFRNWTWADIKGKI